MKKNILTILTLVLTVALGAQVANAIGSLTPSGTAGDATQYTLNDIYTKLTTNVATSTKSGLFSTPGSAVATFRTLTEIYNAIPTIDAAKVAVGTTYLGVAGVANIPPTLIWQDDPQLQLCWDGSQSCSGGSGLLDPVGDGSILLGAVEYCQYLDENGTTVQATPQNIWHLPTIGEYMSIINFSSSVPATQVSGFYGFNYWSGTEYHVNPTNAWYLSLNSGESDYSSKTYSPYVRCVR